MGELKESNKYLYDITSGDLIEIIYIHGYRVQHNITNGTYKYFTTVIETTSENDMANKIKLLNRH